MVAALLAAACGVVDEGEARTVESPAGHTNPDSAAARAVRARYPRARIEAGPAAPGPEPAYRAGRFRFRTPGDEHAYGEIVAVWTADAGRLVWTHEHPGDTPPHALVWLDADADGRRDLFFTAGEEDVSETYLFLNHTGGGAAPDSAFTLAYRSANGYTTLLDLDGDGAPELIDSGHAGVEHVDTEACIGSPPPDDVERGAAQEYARLAAGFDTANVKFGGDFAPWTLNLLDPVKILQIRDGAVRDVTGAFSEHLRWRVGMLRAWRAAAPPGCRAHLDGVIAHLRRAGG